MELFLWDLELFFQKWHPLGALLAGILFFWVAGKDFVLAAVNKGAGKPIGAWF